MRAIRAPDQSEASILALIPFLDVLRKMNKIFHVIAFLILACVLIGCDRNHAGDTNRPYVFVDEAGEEYRGFYNYTRLPPVVAERTGQLKVFYESGEKFIVGDLVDGKRHGVIRMWDQNGNLFVEENWADDVRHGELTWWHPGGQKKMRVDWVKGQKHGFWIEWDEEGNEVVRRFFEFDEEQNKPELGNGGNVSGKERSP